MLLPDFTSNSLEVFEMCGVIRSPAQGESQWPTEGYERIETCIDGFLVRLLCNRQEVGLHFHVDATRNGEVDSGHAVTSEQMIERISLFAAGNKIVLLSRGEFRVPRDDLLDDSAVNLLLDVSVGPEQCRVSLDGASYRVTPGPVWRIRWVAGEDDDGNEYIVCTVNSKTEVPMSETFMQDRLEELTAAFRTFILEDFSGIQQEARS